LDDKKKDILQERIDRAEKLLLTCGHLEGWDTQDRCSFSEFLYMTTRNGIVVGRAATEVIHVVDPARPDERKFHSFRPTDAGTIYFASHNREASQRVREEAVALLSRLKNEKLKPELFEADKYSWVQVIEGRPMQAFAHDEMLVHNFYPVTDIELQGYPLTPLDCAINAVTTHINIGTHNRVYFQNGRASRGMLVIKSNDVDVEVVQAVKQQFNASINGASNSWRMPVFGIGPEDELTWQPIDSGGRDMEFQFLADSNARTIMAAFQISPEEVPGYQHLCVHRDTRVWTNEGCRTIGEILGDKKEASGFKVWTGEALVDARAFVSGPRRVCTTKLSNGSKLLTSPDHLFRIVSDDGSLVWKRQEDLNEGDFVLVNRNEVPGAGKVPSYHGKTLDEGMLEVLGWLVGDGSLLVRKNGKVKHSKELHFYYHHVKEPWIRERHVAAMTSWGLTPTVRDRHFSDDDVQYYKDACDVKTIAPVRLSATLHNTKFVDWLIELGFRPSADGKRIPSFLHSLPRNLRAAFLRGLFSADGTREPSGTPSVTVFDDVLRSDVKMLLLSLGIRTRACEGTHKREWSGVPGKPKRTLVAGESKLFIKDKRKYDEVIGFLQPHKEQKKPHDSLGKWDKIPASVAIRLANEIRARKDVSGADRDDIRHILIDPKTPYRCRSIVERYAEQHGQPLPVWVSEYSFESVLSCDRSDDVVEMVDIEVYDNSHVFMAEGVVVHNTRGSNSQSLSECFPFTGHVLVKNLGLVSAFSFLDGLDAREGEFWSGSKWVPGRMFRSGDKRLVETELACGVIIQTSPDHRFRVVDDTGDVAWKRQEDLVIGDWVLVNGQMVDGSESEIPSFKGRKLTVDMMEILGWAAGDGCIVPPKSRVGAQFKLLYQHHNEVDVWRHHHEVLTAWGLNNKNQRSELSSEKVEAVKIKYGFASVSDHNIQNVVYDTDFVRWLMSLGFGDSTSGKVIPSFVHALPAEYRQAYLRGLFSADGHRTSNGSVILTCQNDALRDQTRQLLLGLGIRTLALKGLWRESFGEVRFSYKLSIKDRAEFWKQIGFVQPRKQQNRKQNWNIGDLPRCVALRLLKMCADSSLFGGLEKGLRDSVGSAIKGRTKCSSQFVRRVLGLCEVSPPDWFEECRIEKVTALQDLGVTVPMVDIEMYSEDHSFILDGAVVHNSNEEYKLTAARDVGIRPLLAQLEDWLSADILPLIDRELSKICRIHLVGLDIDTEEKESVRLQQDAPLHLTYDEILQKVEKDPVGPELTGTFPLNPTVWQNITQYLTFGEIQERLMGVKDASKDPAKAFYQNPMWMQWQQLQAQMQAQQQQAQQQAQQPQGGPPGQGGGAEQGGDPGQQGGAPPAQDGGSQQGGPSQGSELASGIDQAIQAVGQGLQKGEHQLPAAKKKLKEQIAATNRAIMDAWRAEAKQMIKDVSEIVSDVADRQIPKAGA
jgi:intein/homing endonuclease